jgi:hypothetical protein
MDQTSAVPDLYFDYKGWRFRPPFHCMYCGIEVSVRQWAFSRSCGGCDVSPSYTARLPFVSYYIFAGPHELIDPNDPYFLEEARFLSPEDAEKHPILNPPAPRIPHEWTRQPGEVLQGESPKPGPDRQGEF